MWRRFWVIQQKLLFNSVFVTQKKRDKVLIRNLQMCIYQLKNIYGNYIWNAFRHFWQTKIILVSGYINDLFWQYVKSLARGHVSSETSFQEVAHVSVDMVVGCASKAMILISVPLRKIKRKVRKGHLHDEFREWYIMRMVQHLTPGISFVHFRCPLWLKSVTPVTYQVFYTALNTLRL